MPVTNTDISLRLFVDDIATTIAAYDAIQVQRSTGDENGPWEPITSAAAAAAVLLGTKHEPYRLQGLTLVVRTGGLTDHSRTFVGADPTTAAAAAAELTAALGVDGIAADVGGYIRLTTTDTGTDASTDIRGDDAYANAGFALGAFALGTDAHIPLVAGVQDYTLVDHNGALTYWYRTRYYNSVSGATSVYSVPLPADPVYVLPSTDLITGTCHLTDLSGRALVNQRLIVSNVFEPSTHSGWGVFGAEREVRTDADGYAELKLVRGSLVEVQFEHTSIRRRLRVPTAGAEFDFLDPTLADDEFGIAVPVLKIAAPHSP